MSDYDVEAHANDEVRHEEFIARIAAYGAPEELDAAYDVREAYGLDDPKHPDHYERLVDIWDARWREGK